MGGPGWPGRLFAFVAMMVATIQVKLLARLLEIIEVAGINRYDKCWNRLDEKAQEFLASWLFPQQVLTRQSIGLLIESSSRFAGTTTP